MICLYRLLYPLAALCALPYYAARMWRRGGYRRDFAHRFGALGNIPPKRTGVQRIWIQAVSVGELLAIGPLLEQLAKNPQIEVCLTTTTSTGRRLLEEKYASHSIWRGIFPMDWWCFSARAWKRLQPDLAILMESELWPEHLHQAKRHGIPVLLLNARLSDRSYQRYTRLKALIRPLLRPLSAIQAGSPQDAERLQSLQLGDIPIETAGNMKFDVALKDPIPPEAQAALRTEIGAGPDERILLGASTWPGEEEMVSAAAATARKKGLAVKAVIVPRHAERRESIATALAQHWGKVHFRTDGRRAAEGTDIYVADTTGELARFVQIADLVFVGKTMPPHTEGQTPIEAAAHGKAIIFGPGTANFRQIAAALVEAGAAHRVSTQPEFEDAVKVLLHDPDTRLKMGRNGAALCQNSSGATGKALALIEKTLKAPLQG